MPDNGSVKGGFKKFAKNKPLFYGTIAAGAIGAIIWYRHKQSQAGQVTDPAGNTCSALNPQTGFCPGTPEDQQAMQSGGFVGNPRGAGGGSRGGPNIINHVTTKEEWLKEAENVLPNGHSVEVRNALLEVLAGNTVTSAQRDIFLEAVGALGEPPGGYPKPIKVKNPRGHDLPHIHSHKIITAPVNQ